MQNNYQRLLNLKPHNWWALIIVVLATTFLTIYICNHKLYDRLFLIAVSDGVNLNIDVPLTYSDTLHDGAILKINDKKYDYTIQNISEIKYDEIEKINYQTFTINIAKPSFVNEIIKVCFYYNQEKISQKIIQFIKE